MNMVAFSKHNTEVVNNCKTEFGKFIECCSDLSSIEKISEGYEVAEQYIRTSNFETLLSSFNKEGKQLHQAMIYANGYDHARLYQGCSKWRLNNAFEYSRTVHKILLCL